MITLQEGLQLQNEVGVFEVVKVQRNRVIGTVENMLTGEISTHTSEEFNKYFTTLQGEMILDENKD